MSMIASSRRTGFPKVCWGCKQPFPVRAGHSEALVGRDGHLYCYAGRQDCTERAIAGTRKAA